MSNPLVRSAARPPFVDSRAFTLFSLIGTSFRCSVRRPPIDHAGSVRAALDEQLAELADPAVERDRHRAACERRRRAA